jgi:3-dehydroquinate dehydratase
MSQYNEQIQAWARRHEAIVDAVQSDDVEELRASIATAGAVGYHGVVLNPGGFVNSSDAELKLQVCCWRHSSHGVGVRGRSA